MATFLAADYATGFNFTLAGWLRSTGSSAVQIADITSPSQRVVKAQSTTVPMMFYNDTSFSTMLIRSSFVLPSSNGNIQNIKGVFFGDGLTGNAYACVHNGGNPGTIEIRKVTAAVMAGTALASVASTTGVVDDVFEFDFNPVTYEIVGRQNGVVKITYTIDLVDQFPNCIYSGLFGFGSNSNILSFASQGVGGQINTLTTPMKAGGAFSGTCAGFSDGAGTVTVSGFSSPVTFAGGGTTLSGTFAMPVDDTLYPVMGSASLVFTFAQGAVTAEISRPFAVADDYAITQFGTVVNDNPLFFSYPFAQAGDPLLTGEYAYLNLPASAVVDPDGRIRDFDPDDLPYPTTAIIHRTGGKTYLHDMTFGEGGAVGVAPTMTPTASATVNVGDTVVGTYAASAGTAPIDYSLNNTDAALFAVNSSTAAVTFSPAADTPGVYTVGVVAENAYGTATTVLTVTVEAVITEPTIESVGTIRIGGTAAVTVSGFGGPITSGTLDGVALTSADDEEIVMAALVDGVATYRPGNRDLMLTDGTDSDTVNEPVGAPTGWSSYVIAAEFVEAVNGSAADYLPVGWVAGDFILSPNSPSSGKTTTVSDAGVITSNVGTQELFLVDADTGLATAFDIVTTAGAGSIGAGGAATNTLGMRGITMRGM